MTFAMWDTISAKQMEFMRRREKYIAYGGARGGGKSWVARTKAVGMCLRYAGLRVLMVRKTFAQLRENIVLPMQEQFAPLYRAGAMRYNGQNNEVRFYNGSRIVFGYCDSDRDLLQYQGVEYDVIFLEEATQLSEYQFGIMRVQQLERENARYQRQQAELAQRRQMDQAYQRLMQEADGVKAQYPAFDLNAEMQDPDFVRLLRAQVPLKTIYEVRHQDEILGGAMQYTAQKVAAKVAAGVSANRGRPAENGAAASGASGARFDVEHSTKEQRMALIRRAANGERIEF